MTRTDDTWSNWAGNVTASPRDVADPADADEVAAVVTSAAQAGRRVKPIGAGHSFTAVAATDGVQLRLDKLSGLIHIDRDAQPGHGRRRDHHRRSQPTAGRTRPRPGESRRHRPADDHRRDLHRHPRHRRRASAGWRPRSADWNSCWPTANKINCSTEQHPDIFAAARVGLGALGVITEVTLQCVPAFRLRAVEGPAPLDARSASRSTLTSTSMIISSSTGSPTPTAR